MDAASYGQWKALYKYDRKKAQKRFLLTGKVKLTVHDPEKSGCFNASPPSPWSLYTKLNYQMRSNSLLSLEQRKNKLEITSSDCFKSAWANEIHPRVLKELATVIVETVKPQEDFFAEASEVNSIDEWNPVRPLLPSH